MIRHYENPVFHNPLNTQKPVSLVEIENNSPIFCFIMKGDIRGAPNEKHILFVSLSIPLTASKSIGLIGTCKF